MRLFLTLLSVGHLTYSLTWGLQSRMPGYQRNPTMPIRRYYPDTSLTWPQEPDSHENTDGREVVHSSVVPVSSAMYPTAAAASPTVPSGDPESTQGTGMTTLFIGVSASATPSGLDDSAIQISLSPITTPLTTSPFTLPMYRPNDISQTASSYPVDTPSSGVDDCESLLVSPRDFPRTSNPTTPTPAATPSSDLPEVPADFISESESLYATVVPSDRDSRSISPTEETPTAVVRNTDQDHESSHQPTYPVVTPEHSSTPTTTPSGDGNVTGSEGGYNDGVASDSYRAGEVDPTMPDVHDDSTLTTSPSAITLIVTISGDYPVPSAPTTPTTTTCTTSHTGQHGTSYSFIGWSNVPIATPFTYSASPNPQYVTRYHTIEAPVVATPTMTPDHD
ncbi:hypothetical protein IWQ61_005259 [Dispira simplex]|nr:hypothetical protein IWQ61_005259 [Dispira simplex]